MFMVLLFPGPWTWKLRNYFDPCNYNPEAQPKILLEGPFGGGNQDWYKFEVAVMVGGGIGVTPYASILNDLVFGTSTNRYSGVACKKVRNQVLPCSNMRIKRDSGIGVLLVDMPVA